MSKLEIRNEEMALGASSLPYPEPAIRLIRQDKIDEFNRRMTELRPRPRRGRGPVGRCGRSPTEPRAATEGLAEALET